MVRNGSVTRLIQLLRSDDAAERDLAARLFWRRYFRDLLQLARNNLNRRIRRREDEEDVLQWRATPTARSPIGSTAPNDRSSGEWNAYATSGLYTTISRNNCEACNGRDPKF